MQKTLFFLMSILCVSTIHAIGPFDAGPFDIEQPGQPSAPQTGTENPNYPNNDGRPQRM